MTAAAWLVGALGVVLVWTGVKGEDPREVIAGLFRSRASSAVPAGVAIGKAAAATSAAVRAGG